MTKRPVALIKAVASLLTSIFLIAGSSLASAQQAPSQQPPPWRAVYLPDGTVRAPEFELPPSNFLSPEGVMFLKMRAAMPAPPVMDGKLEIKDLRAGIENMMAPLVQMAKARYPVTIEQEKIGGVPTSIITPKDGIANENRILINLHGGAFNSCAGACSLAESIPIAAVGKIKVISVDYRQGPEHVFPAASEDVAMVYKALLKKYKPKNIGIYGCSAGGALTAQAAAWFQQEKLPNPGAIGIFGAAAGRVGLGDSGYIAARVDGAFPPPPLPGEAIQPQPFRSYFDGVDLKDPMVSPLTSPGILAKFPPTLLVTGTRAMDLSGAVYTHTQLVKAGVEGDLIVGEGLGHCYIMNPELPEARDAYDIITKFFDKHLGK